MKGSFVFILLLLAIVTATKQHVHKSNAQGDRIDQLAAGLKEVEEHLPLNSSFAFKMPEGAPGDVYMLWRYLLAPRYCSIDPKERFDTVFTIFNTNVNDSAVLHLVNTSTVICSNTYGQYK